MRNTIFLFFLLGCFFNSQAQFNGGIKSIGGMSFIQNPRAELTKSGHYNFDIEPYQYAYDVAAFVQYSYKKMAIKGNIGYWSANFTTYSNVKPPDIDDGNFLTYPTELYPVYFKTDRNYRYPYFGLGMLYQINSKWNVGIGYKHLFFKEKYMATLIEDFVTTPEVQGLTRNKTRVKGGNYDMRRRVSLLNFNLNYQFAPRFALLFEYQRNIDNLSLIHKHYFNIFNIGLNFTIRPTKPYQKDEAIYY